MIGIDITAIKRFKKSTESLATKILTPDEMLEYNAVKNKANYLAGRWACKESVFKATGLTNVTVLSDPNGKPYVKDHRDIMVSISHDQSYAVAMAVQKNV
jgi:holo-[acyl-carrier protein] synthase